MPLSMRKPVDMREVIARIADASEFLEFKPAYGRVTVCGLGAIAGHNGRFHHQQRPDRCGRRHQGDAVHPALLPGAERR